MRTWAAIVLWGVAAGAALAQAGERLNAAQAREALFGNELIGVTEVSREPWRECIDTTGRTAFRLPNLHTWGRVEIRDDGQACFRYAHTNFREEACWIISREGEVLRFESPSGASEAYLARAEPRPDGCDALAPTV